MDMYEYANEGVIAFNKRRIGNTTRLIDNAIQLLFRGVDVAMYENGCTSKEKVLDITKKQEKGLSKATLNTKHPNAWKINHKNALKHFEKLYNRKFRFLKTN